MLKELISEGFLFFFCEGFFFFFFDRMNEMELYEIRKLNQEMSWES